MPLCVGASQDEGGGVAADTPATPSCSSGSSSTSCRSCWSTVVMPDTALGRSCPAAPGGPPAAAQAYIVRPVWYGGAGAPTTGCGHRLWPQACPTRTARTRLISQWNDGRRPAPAADGAQPQSSCRDICIGRHRPDWLTVHGPSVAQHSCVCCLWPKSRSSGGGSASGLSAELSAERAQSMAMCD